MQTLLYIHGTGTIRSSFDKTLKVIESSAKKARLDVQTKGVFWADPRKDLNNIPLRCVPSESTTENQQRTNTALWSVLVADPLAELRIGRPRDSKHTRTIVDWAGLVSNLDFQITPFSDPWIPNWLKSHLTDAAAWLKTTAEFAAITKTQQVNNVETSEILGRAIVGRCFSVRPNKDEILFADSRQVLAVAIAKQLWPDEFGAGSTAKNILAPFATEILKATRSHFNFGVSRVIGDILAYQANPKGAFREIAEELESISSSVTLLAHSLGAIAAFEFLVHHQPANVTGFISIGTQIGLFDELKALGAADSSVSRFPRWVNVYDPADFLSYLTQPAFPTLCELDLPVDNGLPFPDSHSGYWTNPRVWECVADMIGRAS